MRLGFTCRAYVVLASALLAGVLVAGCERHLPVAPAVVPIERQAALTRPSEVEPGRRSMREATATALSLDEVVKSAVTTHPRIRAARERMVASAERVPQALALDDPVLTNSFYPITDHSLQTAAGRAGVSLSVSQKYPWPGKRGTRGAVVECEERVATARLRQVELEVEEATRLAYYELWYADKAKRISEGSRKVAEGLVRLALTQHAAGGSQQDVLRAQAEVDALDDSLVGLVRRKAVAQADLAALAGDARTSRVEPTGDLDVGLSVAELDTLLAAVLECSPWLLEQRWAISRAHQEERLAALKKYPDFVLGAGWQSVSESAAVASTANGRDSVGFSVGVTLPIWGASIDAAVREAVAKVAASERDYAARRDEAYRQVRRYSDEADAAAQRLTLYEHRILPRARRALDLASADYRSQRAGFNEVADRFLELLTYELQEARARVERAGAVAHLRRAVGCAVAAPRS